MAITEAQREKAEKEKLENGVAICEQALQKAEKYERLQENNDWKEYLEDLRVLIGAIQKDIDFAVMMMVDAPNTTVVKMGESGKEATVSSKQDWADFIIQKKVRKDTIEGWLTEPEKILFLAKQSRDLLPKLKEKISVLEAGENHAEASGK